jgi:hypothetical protein
METKDPPRVRENTQGKSLRKNCEEEVGYC